ncbi:MAG: DUF2064 domain-containing protein [Halobacteriales archaeon]|nr:DUF2064 domain-containing protein [Halobacteriales archaeon]
MTVHALVADPPRPGLALPALVEAGALDAEDAATLAGAMLRDAAVAATDSGGDLLVNHPTADQLPAEHRGGLAPAEALRSLVGDAVDDSGEVRFEPQVGDDPVERVGNTLTHLLESEEAASVALLDGRAPTLDRTALDSAAMKLRRHEAVVGPAPDGRVTYLGLTEPLDLDGLAYPFSLEALVDRAVEAGHSVEFLPVHPRVERAADLATLEPLVAARRAAGRRVPPHTAAALEAVAP